MRKTIQVITYTDATVCDACLQKDGTDVVASDVLSLGSRSWDLCPSHAKRFGSWLADALDESEVTEPDDVQHQGQEHAGVEDGETAGQVVSAHVGTDVEMAAQHVQERNRADTASVPQPSVMVSGVVEGYDWDSVRDAVRNLGYRVVGRADDSTVLLIAGTGAEKATAKLRDAQERSIPCMDVTVSGRFRDAVCAGELRGGDPLPGPVRKDAQAVREEQAEAEAKWQVEKNERLAESSVRWAQERRRKEDAEIRRMATAHLPKPKPESQKIREWARENGYNVSERGRISMQIKHAYKLAIEAKAVAA
ncbi:Lsr2 family DNA-binding protein [Streptomyces violascens]|uniref:Lsr2 family DNA-binding protein n=1 Tax=Streptomyces violascens TaxID=67381 RepID=UPI0036539681